MEKDTVLSYLLYLGCVLLGALIGYFVIKLHPSAIEKQVVEVKVDIPDPVVIHDTITITEVKYKYIYKNRGGSENLKKDTLE